MSHQKGSNKINNNAIFQKVAAQLFFISNSYFHRLINNTDRTLDVVFSRFIGFC